MPGKFVCNIRYLSSLRYGPRDLHWWHNQFGDASEDQQKLYPSKHYKLYLGAGIKAHQLIQDFNVSWQRRIIVPIPRHAHNVKERGWISKLERVTEKPK